MPLSIKLRPDEGLFIGNVLVRAPHDRCARIIIETPYVRALRESVVQAHPAEARAYLAGDPTVEFHDLMSAEAKR